MAATLNALLQVHVLLLGASVNAFQLLLVLWIPLAGAVVCVPTIITRQAKDAKVKQACSFAAASEKWTLPQISS